MTVIHVNTILIITYLSHREKRAVDGKQGPVRPAPAHGNGPAVILDNAVTNGQAKASAFACLLGGEKGFKFSRGSYFFQTKRKISSWRIPGTT